MTITVSGSASARFASAARTLSAQRDVGLALGDEAVEVGVHERGAAQRQT